MRAMNCDVAIIGGGPAGLAAAEAAKKEGAEHVCIIERDEHLGGILNQCIHPGFGLHTFGEELTGPEYAARFVQKAKQAQADVLLGTMVLEVRPDRTLLVVGRQTGLMEIRAKAIVLAMGCRERPRGAINIPGTRPSGVYAAGTAQRLMNIEGEMVGRNVVILGSGDIGLIMARRMTYEGAKVHAVCELMPYSSGLGRNIAQCLHDLDIPLLLSHTAVDIQGEDRVKAVTVAKVDETLQPIAGTEITFPCDTLLLSVGLLPENELSRTCGLALDRVTNGPVVDDHLMTSMEGIFACGNVLHVHDLVDFVSQEAANAGRYAAQYAAKGKVEAEQIPLQTGEHVLYTVPQKAQIGPVTIRFRVDRPIHRPRIIVERGGVVLYSKPKLVCAPGEMETVQVDLAPAADEQGPIVVRVQEGKK